MLTMIINTIECWETVYCCWIFTWRI